MEKIKHVSIKIIIEILVNYVGIEFVFPFGNTNDVKEFPSILSLNDVERIPQSR